MFRRQEQLGTVSIHDFVPVRASSSGCIDAAPDDVWAVLTDLARWPDWNEDIAAMAVEGPLSPGTRFRWKAGGMSIVSRLVEVAPAGRIAWTGRMPGVSAVHVWELEPHPGGTLVRTEETFSGLIPRLMPGLMQRMLQKTLDKGIGMLKVECERRARPDS